MAKGKMPSIFVSSTCFDLKQIRADLNDFIRSLGYDPVLSEFDSFPVEPNSNAVDNCLQVVESHADIFVLVIGGRYGSQDAEGKSVTNLEYLRAKALGIPIYVFVQKNILNVLPVWKENPESQFKSVVDTPKLFEFVDSIRSKDNYWVHEFDTAQDITYTLRQQLAYLFADSLDIRKKIYDNPTGLTRVLKGAALRIITDKPLAWEYRLFSTILDEGIQSCIEQRQDFKNGIAFGKGKIFYDLSEFIAWCTPEWTHLERIADNLKVIFEKINEAFGEHGIPGDPDQIVYATNKFVEGYRNAISWGLEFKKLHVDEQWTPLIASMSNALEIMLFEIEEYNRKVKSQLERAIKLVHHGESVELDFVLTLSGTGLEEVSNELQNLSLSRNPLRNRMRGQLS